MNALSCPEARVIVPPLLMLIAVALPRPAINAFDPLARLTACATFNTPLNDWLPLMVTVPELALKPMIPVVPPAPNTENV